MGISFYKVNKERYYETLDEHNSLRTALDNAILCGDREEETALCEELDKINSYTGYTEESCFRDVYCLVEFFNKLYSPATVISKDDIARLLDSCTQVIGNHELAIQYLPYEDGVYDDDYFSDVEYIDYVFRRTLDDMTDDDVLIMELY